MLLPHCCYIICTLFLRHILHITLYTSHFTRHTSDITVDYVHSAFVCIMQGRINYAPAASFAFLSHLDTKTEKFHYIIKFIIPSFLSPLDFYTIFNKSPLPLTQRYSLTSTVCNLIINFSSFINFTHRRRCKSNARSALILTSSPYSRSCRGKFKFNSGLVANVNYRRRKQRRKIKLSISNLTPFPPTRPSHASETSLRIEIVLFATSGSLLVISSLWWLGVSVP